ncbi:ATP synthase subunit c [bacterium BMS3Abin14]|nr:ATP synthase subunit c [bacterium BMS3Abin14]
MRRPYITTLMAILFLFIMAPAAFAAEAGALPELVGLGVALASGLGIGLAALGGGIGQGLAVKGAVEGLARNPGASGKLMVFMIIGLAMIESLVIYALVISFLLIFKI